MEPGIAIMPIDTVVTHGNMEGRCGYTIGQADTTATIQIVPFDDDWETVLQNNTFKVLRYPQLS